MSRSAFGIDHTEISKGFAAVGSQRALKNISAQVKAGKMSLKDAKINANFAQKQINNAQKASVQKSDTTSAFGVDHSKEA